MALAAGMTTAPALAQADVSFSIPAKSLSEQLVDFALQANVTIGGVSACVGRGAAFEGRYSLQEGLRRLLAGAPCRFAIVAPQTVQITAAPPASPAPRQTAATPSDGEEVLVTATKRSVLADRLPAAVSIISGEQLSRREDFDVTDTVGQIAGMSMTNLGPGRDKILLRGLSDGTFTGRTQSTVGTYLDDLPINYNAPDPDLRLADLDSIEVVRGPQGALYGGGSLSGIYRMVTHKPDLADYAADLTVSESWTQGAAGSRSAEGMVNLPLLTDQAALRLVGYADHDGGYLGNSDLKQSDVDRTTRNGGRATVATRVGDDWQVTLAETLQQLRSADAQYTVMGSSPLNRANRISENQHSDFSQTTLTIADQAAWGRLQSATGYVHHTYASRYDASAALSLFDDTDKNDLGVYDETVHIDMIVEDLVATSAGDGPLQWLVGAFASFSDEKTLSILQTRTGSGPPKPRYQEDRTDRLDELAPYAELTAMLAPGWSVTGGLRYFLTDLTTQSQVVLPDPTANRLLDRSARYRGWAPKLSLQHDFASGDLAYAMISEGYRAGGFNAGGLSPPPASRTVFSPDRLVNFEIGGKWHLGDPRLELRSALFADLWNNIQTDQYLASGLSYTANVGDARIVGWEAEIAAHPWDGVTLQVNALLDSAQVTKVNPAFAAHVESGLPGVPDQSIGALASYERALGGPYILLLSGEASYIGASRLTFDPTQSPAMGGYLDGRLSAQLSAPGWRLAALLTNPANITGDTFAFGNPFSFGQVRQVTPLRPRTLSLILSAFF